MQSPGAPLVEQHADVQVATKTPVLGKAPARHLTALDIAFITAQVSLIACHVLAAWLALGWITAAVLDAIYTIYLLALALHAAWRPLLLRLMALGLVAGVCELFTDASGEHVVHSLIYPQGAPMLWDSPVYMPVSWMVSLTLLGYLGWRLRELSPRVSLWAAALVTGLAGAVIVPFYEEMAYLAGWWRYASAPGLWHTPYYVALFEGLVVAALPVLLMGLQRRTWAAVALRGLALGAWMPVAALMAWLLIGR
jgi:hypothetical protein